MLSAVVKRYEDRLLDVKLQRVGTRSESDVINGKAKSLGNYYQSVLPSLNGKYAFSLYLKKIK